MSTLIRGFETLKVEGITGTIRWCNSTTGTSLPVTSKYGKNTSAHAAVSKVKLHGSDYLPGAPAAPRLRRSARSKAVARVDNSFASRRLNSKGPIYTLLLNNFRLHMSIVKVEQPWPRLRTHIQRRRRRQQLLLLPCFLASPSWLLRRFIDMRA